MVFGVSIIYNMYFFNSNLFMCLRLFVYIGYYSKYTYFLYSDIKIDENENLNSLHIEYCQDNDFMGHINIYNVLFLYMTSAAYSVIPHSQQMHVFKQLTHILFISAFPFQDVFQKRYTII